MRSDTPATMGSAGPATDPGRAAPSDVDELLFQAASASDRLRRAVDETVRLLGASGAMVYLLDEAGTTLRWAYDSGIDTTGERGWVRDLEFPLEMGLFGRAIRERTSQRTTDYLFDVALPPRADAGPVRPRLRRSQPRRVAR